MTGVHTDGATVQFIKTIPNIIDIDQNIDLDT